MKQIWQRIKYTKWKPIRYCWPYPEGYGIFRKNRFTGGMIVIDQYPTKEMAQTACDQQNTNQ